MPRPKGHKLSEESKKKISEKRKGMKFSPEHIENLSKSHLGKKLPEEQKKKIGQSLKGHEVSNQSREKISNANRGKIRNEQWRKIISIGQKKRFEKPEEREKSRLISLEIQSRPGQKEKTSKSLKATYSTPEMRAQQREHRYMVKYHRTPKNEKLVQSFLTEQNIAFEAHYTVRLPLPRKYAEADILIKPNKIIDIRGDRYHANPNHYAPDVMMKGIRNGNISAGDIQKRDKETVEMITKAGYDILILWEHEFGNRNNPRITDEVRKKILDFLKPV